MKKIIQLSLIPIFLLYSACSNGQNSTKSNDSEKHRMQLLDNSTKPKLAITNTKQDTLRIDSNTERQNETVIQQENIPNGHTFPRNDSTTIDTTLLELKNGERLSIPLANNGLTKVVMVNEKSKFDFLKYLLPIFTLLLGIWIKEFLDKRNEAKKIKKSGERWIAELRSLEEPLQKQIDALNKFLEEHGTNEFSIPRIVFYSSLNGEVFKSLDKSELIQFIQMGNKKMDFKNIVKISNSTHGYVSLLIHLYDSLKEKFNKYLSETSKYVDALNSSLQSFGVAFADYQVELETEIGTDPIKDARFKPIADLYSEHIIPHITDGKFNPFKLKDEFFFPVLNILSHNRLDIRTKPMLIAVNAALNSIKGIEMEKHYVNEITNKMIEYYEKQLEDLEGIVNKIEKVQTRNP